MTDDKQMIAPVLVAGGYKTADTVAICLLLAHQPVVLLTQHVSQTIENLNSHAEDISSQWGYRLNDFLNGK